MSEPSAPFSSISPSQPIPLFLDYGVFQTPQIPKDAIVITTTLDAD